MNTKKQKENNKNKSKEIKNKIDEKVYARIKVKFKEYWKALFKLIGVYIAAYLFWDFIIVGKGKEFTDSIGLNGNVFWFVLFMATIQGLLFTLDGFVTALLKSPFNQMCYVINKAEGISDKKKDYIITKATESNEHCKETLKKFGIITIASGLLKAFIKIQHQENRKYKLFEKGKYERWMIISYLIPIFFAAFDIWLIRRELKKIEKSLVAARGKKT